MTSEYLDPAAKYVFKYGVGYSVFLIFIWPLAVIAWGVFDKANYTLWASVAYCWGYIGSLVIVVLPVYESWGSLSVKVPPVQGSSAPDEKKTFVTLPGIA